MACTCLLAQQSQPVYFPLLEVGNGPFSGGEPQELGGPGVRALQAWIEDAWRRGMHLLANYYIVNFVTPFSRLR
jgi:hypothetical protein